MVTGEGRLLLAAFAVGVIAFFCKPFWLRNYISYVKRLDPHAKWIVLGFVAGFMCAVLVVVSLSLLNMI